MFNNIDPTNALFWLLVALGILLIIEIAVFALLMIRRNREVVEPEKPAAEPRQLVGITLDTAVVRREYKVGEEFDLSGLVATAHYSDAPYEETLYEFTIITPELIEKLASVGQKPEDFSGCLVYVPSLSIVGKPTVTVTYKNQTAAFAISVVKTAEPAPVAEPQIVYVPAAEPEHKLIGITLNTEYVRKEYTVGETLDLTGLIVYGNYDREPKIEILAEDGYETPDVDMSHVGTPSVRITCGIFVAEFQITVNPVVEEEPVVVEEEPEVIHVQPDPIIIEEQPEVIHIKHEPVVIEEETFEGGTLRYDKSFTARTIQADDETKQWYTEIKNDLLSYKKVKDRMSWKRESYRLGREQFAKLSYRGKTLCLFLPLNPAEIGEDNKYKVEDVSDNSAYADTPLMYRIKNERRVKYAKELIALVAMNLNVPRIEREAVDYYMPYEGVVELINKGLIKRNIKSKEEEAIFDKSAETEVVDEVATTD